MMLIWGFFKTSLYARLVVVAAITFGAWQAERAWYGYQREKVGVKKTEKKIGKANVKAVSASNRARNKSSTPGVRGTRDPNSTDG